MPSCRAAGADSRCEADARLTVGRDQMLDQNAEPLGGAAGKILLHPVRGSGRPRRDHDVAGREPVRGVRDRREWIGVADLAGDFSPWLRNSSIVARIRSSAARTAESMSKT